MIRSGDGGATAGGAAAAPRGRRQRWPGGRGGSGSGASPWWTPHPERCPPSREPRPPPQGGGGNNLCRGDPSLFPGLCAQPRDERRPGRVRGRGKRKGGCKGGLESCSSRRRGGVRRGPAGKERASGRRSPEQRRRFPQGCGEEEAELRSVGAGGGVPSPGSGRRRRGPAGAHPTISRVAAGCPLSPRQLAGRSSGRSRTGRGASRRRIPPDTLQPGRLQRGERGRWGAREAAEAGEPIAPTRAGEEGALRRRGGQGPEKQLENETSGRRSPASRCPAAARRASSSPPHTRRRGAARGAAEALTPPAPSAAAAAARTGGARRRRRSSPWRLLPAAGFPPRGAK